MRHTIKETKLITMNSRLAAAVAVRHETGKFTIQIGHLVYWKNAVIS